MCKHHCNDDDEEELKYSPDEVMRVVGPFEYDRIDATLLPNQKETPEEGGAEVSEKVKGKKIFHWHSSPREALSFKRLSVPASDQLKLQTRRNAGIASIPVNLLYRSLILSASDNIYYVGRGFASKRVLWSDL